jgi:hypothetical protein
MRVHEEVETFSYQMPTAEEYEETWKEMNEEEEEGEGGGNIKGAEQEYPIKICSKLKKWGRKLIKDR